MPNVRVTSLIVVDLHSATSCVKGTTPLILSATSGHTTCVLELLEQGANPNSRSRRATGTTPLFFAAQSGYLDVANILIKKGVSVDTLSMDGGTPLFVAAQSGHVQPCVVKELLDGGGNVNACMKNRATRVASQNGHRTVLCYF